MEKKVSVAMAVYNGSKYLRSQLDSIVQQSHRPFEIVICDDQSQDSTSEVIKAYDSEIKIRYYVNEAKLGVVSNFQKAISLCQGEYIALSDQDDVWYTDKIAISLKKMKEIEQSGLPSLVFTDAEVVDENLKMISPSFWQHRNILPKHRAFSSLLFGNAVTGCTVLMNSVLANLMRNIPKEATMHDAWAGIIAFGFGKVGIINQPTVKYRQHATNVTFNNKKSFAVRSKSLVHEIFSKEERSTFLAKELNQAEAFKRLYEDKLPDKNQEILKKFLKLKNSGFLVRKLDSLRNVTFS